MLCPSCRHPSPEGATFCGECSAALAETIACPDCGSPNPRNQKFCNRCAHALGAKQSAARRPRKTPALPASFCDGRYEVKRFLGEGGKKRVYLAHDSRLERDVALAVIKTEGLDEAGRGRVRREARAMGRLGDHPHVVTVHDVGDEGGEPYIVSQHMAGGSVEDLLQKAEGNRLPITRALEIADQICSALAHAHERGIIHRDLKPANVWLAEDGTAKLGDFGLALAIDRSRLTTEGMMVGTVAYMPPEQALGRTPDARGDLYSLGALLYEMVTGRPPFLGDEAVGVISQHINTPPVAPTWHNPEVPRALEALILRLLGKAPEDRPENAAAVRESLRAIMQSAAPGAPAAEPAAAGEANPLDRLATGVFVGREKEMDALRAGLEDALSGRGRLLMLVGEPGIGKTRTAQELVTYARLRKAQILWGRCYEGEGAPAYWPWVQAVREYVHDRDSKLLLSELGSGAANVGQMVSEVLERLPGLPEPPKMEPEQARFRLFDSITSFLKNASKDQPLVLVLDDLHWADKSSLLLLQFLARELQGARLLVLGTYRDVGLRRQHPLAQTLGELTREQLSERILLRGLTEHDVGRFIEITAGLKPPRALISAVYKETEGNPFFVNEVVRLLVTDGRLQRAEQVKSWSVSIPQGVREVIGRRLDHLSEACNGVLTIASVIGREFSLDALERLSDLKEDRLLEVLDEAISARVIAEVPGTVGRYSFSHALIRETLYEELTTTRRVRLHKQIGEALESLYGSNPEPHLAELAYHFSEAAQGGDVEKAIGYAVRAGERAATQMAHEEAARHYETALQGMELRGPSGEDNRCELLLKLNESLWRAGEYDRAREAALKAAELARKLGEAEILARAALAYGGRFVAFAAVSRDDTLVGLLEEVLNILPNEDSALRARVLARLAEEITFSDPYERRESLSHQAVEMAKRLGEPGVLALILRNTHWALWVPQNIKERSALANEIQELSEKAGDGVMLLEGRLMCLYDLIELGDVEAARRELESCAVLAEELRLPYHRWVLGTTRVLLAFTEGRLLEIEDMAQQILQMGQEAQNENASLVFGLQMLVLFRYQGRHQEVELLVPTFLTAYPLINPNIRSALTMLYADQGREPEVRSLFEELAAHDFADLPYNLAWLASLAFLAEGCAFLGDTNRAKKLYDLLLPHAKLNVTIGPVLSFGATSRYLGIIAVTMGNRQEAVRHFEDALEMNARMGMRQEIAHTEFNYADLLLTHGEPEKQAKGLELLNSALDIGRNLGMKSLVEKAIALKFSALGIPTDDSRTSIDAVAVAVEEERPDLRSHAAPDGTVTILFSDIVDSTLMTEKLGDRRWMDLLRDHNRIVREQLAVHGGFEVKSQGDGFMLAFQSAAGALRCAIATQRSIAAYAKEHPDAAVRVRMGLHTGEAIREADDFFGKNVILAARIAAQAKGGEVLVSSLVKDVTESGKEFGFGEARTLSLKGLSGTYNAFVLKW